MKVKYNLILCFTMALLLCACTSSEEKLEEEIATEVVEPITDVSQISKKNIPEISQLNSICKFATLECYYQNVAKSIKEKGTGIKKIFEEDRKFWTEYTGIAKIGIDMAKGSMELSGLTVNIYIPEAEIISIKVNAESVKDSIVEEDVMFVNEILAEDVTEAINTAQTNMISSIEDDSALLINAKERAKKLIENYIIKLGEAAGVEYEIVWQTEPSISN